MTNLDKILTHDFVQNVLNDGEIISKGRDFKLSDIEFENEPKFTEFEFYIHETGFYCIHLLELCRQLENAIALLSNFRYDSKTEIGRGDHLTYNIENYIIRLSSLSDRVLQTINAGFHLGIDERDVNDRVIINNIKVSRTNVSKHFNEFRKTLKDYTGERNTIVHRHSYMDKQLRRIQIFYHTQLTKGILKDANKSEQFKEIRKEILTKFINDRKKEFRKTNEMCFEKILPIFDDLNDQYLKMKTRLK